MGAKSYVGQTGGSLENLEESRKSVNLTLGVPPLQQRKGLFVMYLHRSIFTMFLAAQFENSSPNPDYYMNKSRASEQEFWQWLKSGFKSALFWAISEHCLVKCSQVLGE